MVSTGEIILTCVCLNFWCESARKLILGEKNAYDVSFSSLLFPLGVSLSGFRVEVVDGVKLHLLDDVSSWKPGDQIVVASTDYSMYQAEEFTLLPCPECSRFQVKVKGIRLLRMLLGKCSSLGFAFLDPLPPLPSQGIITITIIILISKILAAGCFEH